MAFVFKWHKRWVVPAGVKQTVSARQILAMEIGVECLILVVVVLPPPVVGTKANLVQRTQNVQVVCAAAIGTALARETVPPAWPAC